MAGTFGRVAFMNRGIELKGRVHRPAGFDLGKTYPAIVLSTPGSSVKEQIGANYATRLAKRGYLALAFDPSYQGESGGEPRDLDDPSTRAEDIRCAVDYLMTLPCVDEHRVGLLGICAGGGYAVNAALTEHRFKAVATVVANDIGNAFRRAQSVEELRRTLEAVGRQRTTEARGGAQRRDPWIPDSLAEAETAGVTDRDTLEAVHFYRESPWRHVNSTNRLYFGGLGHILGFDPFGLVPDLLTQPLQVIVGGRRGTTGQYEEGERLFELARGRKEFYVVEGAGHYDMYYKSEFLDLAVGRLSDFFKEHLGAPSFPTGLSAQV
jgi:fermentation-respiration switch protein FrsA (DUF1100 family)